MHMELEIKKRCADLLCAATAETISEPEFWRTFKNLKLPTEDPLARIAYEAAIHFWGNFHERNLLLIRTKPDQYQVQQGKDQLNVIAEGLESGWSISELERRLADT